MPQNFDTDALLKAKIPCEETGITVKRTICGFCGGKCLVDAYIKDGKIIKVEGSKSMGGPNKGTLCVKGAALKQTFYHPDRLLCPMKRTGKRGEGKFERISWEEALDIIADKMRETKEKYGARQTMIYAGHPKWFRPQLTQFANAYGTPNLGTESSTCNYARVMAYETCLGKGGRKADPDMQNCRTLLVWGVNQMYSRSNTASREYLDLVERGVNVIAVDPRCTPTTEHATIHLRPLPGTDGALALGLAYVLITEQLYDKEYVEKYTYGFEEYREYVMGFPPQRAEQITGVPAEKIIEAGRLLGTAAPTALQMTSSPMVHHINGVQNTRAIVLLPVLTGSFGVPGGLGAPGKGKPSLKDSFMGTMFHRVDEDQDLSHEQFPCWAKLNYHEMQAIRIADYLEGKGDYPIRTLIAFGMNHHMWPRPDHLEKAFDSLDFFVNVELYRTETCDYADIILPASTSLEREQVETFGGGLLYDQQPIVEPLGEVRSDVEIILNIAEKLGLTIGDPPLKTYEDYLRMSLSPTGVTLEELRSAPDGLKSRNKGKGKTSEEILGNIKTPTGKLEFVSGELETCHKPGHEGLPVYRDFRETLPMDEYPLILCTGCRKPQLFHKRTYRMPWLAGLEESPLIELHPDTAASQGMEEGELVVLRTPVGALEMHLCFNSSCLPGVIHVYHGAKDKDVNRLIDETYLDPISGFPGFKSYCCRLEKKEVSHGTN